MGIAHRKLACIGMVGNAHPTSARFSAKAAADYISPARYRIAGCVRRFRSWLSNRDRVKDAADKSCNVLAHRPCPAKRYSEYSNHRCRASPAYWGGFPVPVRPVRHRDFPAVLRPSRKRHEKRHSRRRSVGRDGSCIHDNADKKTACQ